MLDKTSYKIMRIIRRNQFIQETKLRTYFEKPKQSVMYVQALTMLKTQKYIQPATADKGEYAVGLTALGNGAYEQQKRSNIEFRLTQLFALAGVILSIIALLRG